MHIPQLIPELPDLLAKAWDISRAHCGNTLTVHIPGMFVVNGRRGGFRAVSITGSRCDLDCEHCRGLLLRTMPHAQTPEELLQFGWDAWKRGDHGMLVTGGCDREGKLPWSSFLPVLRRLKQETALKITIHAGQLDLPAARKLKEAGIDQALVDVIGDDETAREVYHLKQGTATVRKTMDALSQAGLEIIPHVLFGLHYGRELGETAAVDMLKQYPLSQYVVVVLMPARETPMADVSPPAPERVAAFLARARIELPHLRASLGCARPRGFYRRTLDVLAVRAGVNSLALPSDQGLEEAERMGLSVVFRETCCSLGLWTPQTRSQ
ncbi:MAG TPA: radical SAM protein [Desulfomonilaceae bacterium]|nr:radical SAM protein [Desulfomonilaceae bacterium]